MFTSQELLRNVASPDITSARKLPVEPDNALIDAYLRRATDRSAASSSADLRDAVYSGASNSAVESAVARPKNRTATRRRVSPFSVVMALLVTAVASVVYISNIIAVGQLVVQVGELEGRNQRLLNEQEMLRAQLNRMSSLERIRQMAETDLGLKNSAAVPGWLTVSPERVREIEAVMQNARRRP